MRWHRHHGHRESEDDASRLRADAVKDTANEYVSMLETLAGLALVLAHASGGGVCEGAVH